MNSLLQVLTANPLPVQESSNSEAETGDQEESSQIARNKPEEPELRNMDITSSSMGMEESKVDVTFEEEPPCSLPAPGEPKSCLTGEESCKDATMVRYFAPIGH